MPSKNIKIIVNPNADSGNAWKTAADLRPIVDEYGGADWSGTVYPTHASELAQQAAESGYEQVIVAGGDGTVHEVINGLMQVPAESRPLLGIIPLGSGNDFAHAVGMDPDPARALRQIFAGQPRPVDIARVTDNLGRTEFWDNTIGIGFDAVVTIRTRSIPVLRGFSMYFTAVMQTIALNHDAPRMEIETDTEQWTENTMMLILCNGPREGGGFRVAPDAVPDDGLLNYTTVRSVSRPMMLRLVPEVMNGTHGRFEQIRMGTFRRLKLRADAPLRIHIDGEIFAGFGSDVRQLDVEILPAALMVQA
jgi:YegS/Rv2252/BmrU family lipid kinase